MLKVCWKTGCCSAGVVLHRATYLSSASWSQLHPAGKKGEEDLNRREARLKTPRKTLKGTHSAEATSSDDYWPVFTLPDHHRSSVSRLASPGLIYI